VNGFAGWTSIALVLLLKGFISRSFSGFHGGHTFFSHLITSSRRGWFAAENPGRRFKAGSSSPKMCLGIHLEGPYISSEEGPREFTYAICPAARWEELEKFQEACEGESSVSPYAGGERSIPFIEKQ